MNVNCLGRGLISKIYRCLVDGSTEMSARNPRSMFLTAVDEKEIIDIVKKKKKSKNKVFTDLNEIDMKVVKRVIEWISNPLIHICNLSFHTGTFPNKMKIAEVIPLSYKTGNRHHFCIFMSIYCVYMRTCAKSVQSSNQSKGVYFEESKI